MTNYKGVSYKKRIKKWVAKFDVDKVTHNAGSYDTEREAVIAMDIYILKNNIDRPLQILKKKE
jgi:hypothetical protein